MYLGLCITIIILYTIAVLVLSWFDKLVPSELTLGIFGFFAGEITCLMLIKKYNLQAGNDDNNIPNIDNTIVTPGEPIETKQGFVQTLQNWNDETNKFLHWEE